MTKRDEPAYAFSESALKHILGGPSKREQFAAMAMQGLLSNDRRLRDYDARNKELHGVSLQRAVAAQAASYADALLAELEKAGGQ
jgi:hypothetical protein